MRQPVGIVLTSAVLAFVAVAAYAANISGTVPVGADDDEFTFQFTNNWNDQSDFACTSNSPFTVTATDGPCDQRFVTTTFDINSGTLSSNAHSFSYTVLCVGNAIKHSLGFDGGGEVPIDEGGFTFVTLGDTITVHTNVGPPTMPTLGEWGFIALLAVVVASGVFVIVRRQRINLQAS